MSGPINKHKQYAETGKYPGGEDFGVDSLSSHSAGGPVHPKSGPYKYMGDHERGARPPIDGNQSNPDHGPK